MSTPRRLQPRHPLSRTLSRLLEALLFSACLVVALALLGVVLYEGYHLQRVYPGVDALQISLGGLAPAQAVLALPQEVDPYLTMPLRLQYDGRTWEIEASQVGVHFDRPAMVRLAHSVGRGRGPRGNLGQQWAAIQVGFSIPYQLAIDQHVAEQFLTELAEQIDRPVQDAALALQGANVVVEPSQVGRVLDVQQSRDRIFAQLARLSGGQVELVVRQVQPELPDVTQAAQQTECILSSAVTLRLPPDALREADTPPGPWLISREMLAEGLHIGRDAGGDATKLVVRLEKDTLRPRINELAEALAVTPVDAKLAYDPESDSFTELTPSQRGQRLDTETTLDQIVAAADSPQCASLGLPPQQEREIVLALVSLAPTVTAETARDLGIRELVVEGLTSFKGSSEARIQNITTATARFHGVVVGPGEVFSFNEHLGDISAETGYEESLIIMGDRTLLGIGGGVCQVATTAFRAAFWGGYPIEERWPHGYRVRVYEPPLGLDATVYAPYVDLKFRNDTPYYMLIQTEADLKTGALAFRFYSTPVGYRVEMEEPKTANRVPHGPDIIEEDPASPVGTRKQVDWAVDGLDVTVVRRIYQGEELVREDTFFSRYEPWQARFRVGTRPVVSEPPEPADEAVEDVGTAGVE